jgi:hypothetical protein
MESLNGEKLLCNVENGTKLPRRRSVSGFQGLGNCVRQSADAPQHSLRYVHLRWLADIVNIHLSPAAAGNPKDMTVRRSYFEDPMLTSQDFGRIVNFYTAVRYVDHHFSP